MSGQAIRVLKQEVRNAEQACSPVAFDEFAGHVP
jgi:hypothetical protein